MAGAASKATVQPYEGQIKSIKVDKCGLQPGSCEGSVILAQDGGGGEVTLAIKPGTWLKRGDQLVTIDELGIGNHVKVEAVQLPGEQLQRITILKTPQETEPQPRIMPVRPRLWVLMRRMWLTNRLILWLHVWGWPDMEPGSYWVRNHSYGAAALRPHLMRDLRALSSPMLHALGWWSS